MKQSGADTLRGAAADLELVEQACGALEAADAHLTEVVRQVLARSPRRVTAEQVAQVLGLTRRGLYKRLGR